MDKKEKKRQSGILVERIAYVEDKRCKGAWHVMGKKNRSLTRV